MKIITILKELRINDGYKRASPWSWDGQLSNLISSSSYQTIQTEKNGMAILLSSPFEQWHFTSQTGHQSQTFWAQVGRYYNKMWEKTQRSLWLAPKRDDLIDFYECHTKGHNELARLSSDGGSAFLCSKLQIHFILQIKRLSQKRVKSESKTTNSSRRFLVMGCISFVKYIQRICLALNTKIITFMFFNLIKKVMVHIF